MHVRIQALVLLALLVLSAALGIAKHNHRFEPRAETCVAAHLDDGTTRPARSAGALTSRGEEHRHDCLGCTVGRPRVLSAADLSASAEQLDPIGRIGKLANPAERTGAPSQGIARGPPVLR